MNIKHSIYPFAVGLLLFGACEDDSRNGQADPVVYIVNNGFQTTTYYDIESELDYTSMSITAAFRRRKPISGLSPHPKRLKPTTFETVRITSCWMKNITLSSAVQVR